MTFLLRVKLLNSDTTFSHFRHVTAGERRRKKTHTEVVSGRKEDDH